MQPFDRTASGKLSPILTKDVTPMVGGVLYPGTTFNAAGGSIFPRVDPVITFLGSGGNEQEYERMMRTSHAIGGAIKQRTTGLTAHGEQVIQGRSRSRASALVRDFLQAFIDAIPRWETLRAEALKTLYYGWQPIEFAWSAEDFRFKGRPYYGIRDAKARKPWAYHFTTDQELAVSSMFGQAQEVYDLTDPDVAARYMVARANATESPYGESELRGAWLLYFIAQQFGKMGTEAYQRSLGVIKATRKNEGASDGLNAATPAQSKAEAELRNVLRQLRSNNLLIESQNWSLDIAENGIGKKVTEMLDYFNTELRIFVVGQNLTSKVEGGSFAAAQAHGDILDNYLMSDARQEAAWWNSGLFAQAIFQNFGAVDSDDMPRWQSRIIDRPNMESTKALFDMGALIDARRVADGTNAALFSGEPGPDDVVLKKSALTPDFGAALAGLAAAPAPAKPAPPVDDGSEEGDDPAPPKSSRVRTLPAETAQSLAESAERAQSAAFRDALGPVYPEMERYYSALGAAWLEANPDPKA